MAKGPQRDVWLDRIVLAALAGVVILGGGGFTVLAMLDKKAPAEMVALVGTASGVLLGWFGRERATRNGHGDQHHAGPNPPSWSPEETWPRPQRGKGKR